MPELPEVETIRIGLSSLLPGKKIKSLSFDWPKSFPNENTLVDKFLVGATVTEVKRRAKLIIIDLDSEYTLLIHLKMTGQLVYKDSKQRFGAGHPNASLINELPDKSTRVILSFDDDSKLFFNDQRKFGWIKLVPTMHVEAHDFISKLGPEPLDPKFNKKAFEARLKSRSNTSIKAALLDQKVIAGIGNIYADESLWEAKIHPAAAVKALTSPQLNKLFEQAINVLNLSIAKGGSTDRNYVNAEGKKGSYLSFANVFRRDGQPCPRCNTTITKIRVAGRGTHICPKCQRIPA